MDTQSVNELDGWIEKLYNCKPLSEQEIKRLCEKVRKGSGRTHPHTPLSPFLSDAEAPD